MKTPAYVLFALCCLLLLLVLFGYALADHNWLAAVAAFFGVVGIIGGMET